MSFSRHILFVKTFVVSAERHVYKTLQWDRSTLFHMLWYKLSRNWVMWCVGIKTENIVHHCMQKISQLVVIYVSCWWWTVVNSFEFKTRIRCLQVVAVLTAVSEEIKSRGGSESNTEYFAALVSYIAAALSLLSCFLAPELVLVCRCSWMDHFWCSWWLIVLIDRWPFLILSWICSRALLLLTFWVLSSKSQLI